MTILHLEDEPGSRVNELLMSPTVTVRLTSPAFDGKANTTLLAYLAVVVGVARSRVSLSAGHTLPFEKAGLVNARDE